ncbi:MAG TPA: glycosyltransferase family 4 protein [Bryobacteraceae bacterium]|jgi:glycosyltransferase involved in cell wall biosynthesis|nr:glycosyltransferase family 4 protein [Bryobacteraceae bacterium]
MKILCIEQFKDLGGGQMSLLDLLPGLRDRGWEPVVAIPGEGALAERVRRLHCDVELFDAPAYASGRKRAIDMFRYATGAPKLTQRITQLAVMRKADMLYVNASRMLPIASLAARRRSIPLVFHCHNRVTQRTAVTLVGASLKLGQALVISCCKYSAEPLRRYVPEQALSIIYNGVADTRLLRSSSKKTHCRIGVIGRIEPEKGQMEFVAAARLLLQTFPACRFVLVGAPLFGGTRYFDRVVEASRGLPIEFLGWQPDVPSILSSLDLLVVPSASFDAAPRVILEAFAAGVPVVAFPSGGVPEIVRDGYNGFLAAKSTPEALADRISFVLRLDPSAQESVILNARNCWRDRHSLEGFRRDVSNFIALAIARKNLVRSVL